MNNKTYSTDNASQCQRILEWLRRETLTTLQAREHLDIMSPAARILDLRKQGYNIKTHWTISDTGKARHRVGCYALFSKSQ